MSEIITININNNLRDSDNNLRQFIIVNTSQIEWQPLSGCSITPGTHEIVLSGESPVCTITMPFSQMPSSGLIQLQIYDEGAPPQKGNDELIDIQLSLNTEPTFSYTRNTSPTCSGSFGSIG